MLGTSNLRLFRLFGVDVSASLSFLLLVAICMIWYGPAQGILAAFAIALSILIHEFGHALVCLRYKLDPSIVLHGLGGLCYHRPASNDKREAIIAAAGPILQVAVGVAALAALVGIGFVSMPWQADSEIASTLMSGSRDVLNFTLIVFAGFSIFWGVLNLIAPIWPLDGGKLFVLLLRRFTTEEKAAEWGLKASLICLIPAGAWAITTTSILLGYLVISIGFNDYQLLRSGTTLFAHGSGRRPKPKASDFAKDLLAQAKDAYAEEDWREAARLCHQLRATGGQIPQKMMDEVWKVMGMATYKGGDYEEAINWLKRAPEDREVTQAIAECEQHLDEA